MHGDAAGAATCTDGERAAIGTRSTRRERGDRGWFGGDSLLAVAAIAAVAVVVVAGLGGDEGDESPAGAATRGTSATPSAGAKPVTSWRDVGYDRTFKADLIEALPEPPELVVLGGSRAQRFEPSHIERVVGLSAFNFAVQNCRPEDAYAISRFLIDRAPDVRLHCLVALQAHTFRDTVMHPGLLFDPRFRRWFPAGLRAEQKAASEPLRVRRMPSRDRYGSRGRILYNAYDRRLANGATQERALRIYRERIVQKETSTAPVDRRRSTGYFRRMLALYNERGVVPAVVLMPYHPEILAVMRAAGWERKLDLLKALLARLQREYDFRVLDYTEIESFGGRPEWFYDGAHITAENAELLFEQAVRDAPECFR